MTSYYFLISITSSTKFQEAEIPKQSSTSHLLLPVYFIVIYDRNVHKRWFKEVIVTHINYHLINLADVYLLNWRMTRHLPQDTTISSSNNQNLGDKYE